MLKCETCGRVYAEYGELVKHRKTHVVMRRPDELPPVSDWIETGTRENPFRDPGGWA